LRIAGGKTIGTFGLNKQVKFTSDGWGKPPKNKVIYERSFFGFTHQPSKNTVVFALQGLIIQVYLSLNELCI
jgi:hypothetical protein